MKERIEKVKDFLADSGFDWEDFEDDEEEDEE